MIKDVDTCPEVQKFVQTKIANNDSFNKEGNDVIDRILRTIKDSLGKTDLKKIKYSMGNLCIY